MPHLPSSRLVFSLILACTLAVAASSARAKEIYVSAAATAPGTGAAEAPFATLSEAKAYAAPFAGREPITIHVAPGTYYLSEPLVFTAAESGTAAAPIVYQADADAEVALSGGSKLQLTWQPYRDGVFVAETAADLQIDQLFVNGQRQRMARYPNFDSAKVTAAYQGYAADAFSPARAAGWQNPAGGYIHAMHLSRWGGYHYQITGKNEQGEVLFEGGWQNNRPSPMHKEFRMVENIFEELDAPGEWFHDAAQRKLYYQPTANVDLASADIEVVRLASLIEFRGSEAAPVRHITFNGFVLRHAARTFMETKEPLLRSDWAIYRGGAIFLTGCEDVRIVDCEFDQLGGNAVYASNYNRRIAVAGCYIHDVGASGVCFVGDPNAVRDPLFAYEQKNDLAKIDRTPGPKTNNYPADCVVEDCLICDVGRVERQTAGVQIEMASGIQIKDCSIYDCSRAGINIGDGAWGGHLIAGCDVFDTVQETHDHGSFNSWGRDRYWRADRPATQAAVDQDPNLPLLDAVQTTVIRDSRFRCDHGWDIDLDDGSSNYDIYNNLCLSGGLKLREGFRRRAWNNITVNNGLHPHVWYNDSGDEVWGNIFMQAPKPALMPTHQAKGKRVDANLYFAPNPEIKNRYLTFGWDVNSIVADPHFVDPANGDFRVQPDSPALAIGFQNFPMDQFGVKSPRLKEIARTPIIPELKFAAPANRPRSENPQPQIPWSTIFLGADVASLQGEEFSAFGVRKEDGGVKVTAILADSPAAAIGLRAGDLIQQFNGRPTKTVGDLTAAYLLAGDKPVTLLVIRDQAEVQLEAANLPYLVYETVDEPAEFITAPLKQPQNMVVATNVPTNNAPVTTLLDGQLNDGYGSVFSNGNRSGVYRIDLGSAQPISAITSWSTNKSGIRGPQHVTIYASDAAADPGWDLTDRAKFTPLATVDTTSQGAKRYAAVSLKAADQQKLGAYRWIYWHVRPITAREENTSFQELHVE